MTSRVVVGGGTGFVGQAVVRQLKQKGYAVSILSRHAGKSDTITWDRIKKEGLPSETHAVVNVSGAPLIAPGKRWNDEYKKEIRDSRIGTNLCLKEAILAAEIKPKVWVSISGVGYYATSLTKVYDEDSAGGDQGYLAVLAKEWEEAGKLPEHCGTRHVIVRSGAVLGKGGGVIKNMIWPFWAGLGGPIGSGKQPFPWIHIEDLAGIFVHAIENDHVQGILNGVAPANDTNETFTEAFGRALNRPTFFRVPSFVVGLTLGEERSPVLIEGQNVKPKRTLEAGYNFTHRHIDSAMKEVVL